MAAESAFNPRYPKGEYRDIVRTPKGDILWQTPWRSNLIVNGLSRVLAALIKGDPEGQPLTFWAVGTGDSLWDEGNIPSEGLRRTFTSLVNETGRKSIQADDIIFVPDNNSNNQIEINIQFNADDILGGVENRQLREFGLFSGGSEEENTGILINHRIHDRIDLQEESPLVRSLRLTF